MAVSAGRRDTSLLPFEANGAGRTAAPFAPQAHLGLPPAAVRAWARLRRVSALVVIGALFAGLGMVGSPFTPGGAFALEAKANALNARWSHMEAQGVPSAELATMRHELAGAHSTKIFKVASVFWWPDASAIIDRWQAQTDAIWAGNIS